MIDFGEMPADVKRTRSLKLRNRGRADVPLKLVLSGVSFFHLKEGRQFAAENEIAIQCFLFLSFEYADISSSFRRRRRKLKRGNMDHKETSDHKKS